MGPATIALAALLAPLPGWQGRGDRSEERVEERAAMVEAVIVREGVTDERILAAMRAVPRHAFVRPADRPRAYLDAALPIGGRGQTISPPFIVAYMTQTLDVRPGMKVLEIGTGSGYQAAVLDALGAEVYSIEIQPSLAKSAGARLEKLGYGVRAREGDGYLGWPEAAPFDRIVATCSPESVPRPLVQQLAEGGKMLIPLGERYQQTFHLFTKKDGELTAEELVPTFFVPMTGRSEDVRRVQPDGTNPVVANASFEKDDDGDGKADGWHYQRQTLLMPDAANADVGDGTGSDPAYARAPVGPAPDGERFLRIVAADPDRLAQVLQGLPVDGKRVAAVGLALRVRGAGLRPPPTGGPAAGAAIYFFDRDRRNLGGALIGPWNGTFDWIERGRRVPVPPDAAEMMIRVAVKGSGTLDVDALDLLVHPRR